MSNKKKSKRPMLTSSVLDVNDELRNKYGDQPITGGQSKPNGSKKRASQNAAKTAETAVKHEGKPAASAAKDNRPVPPAETEPREDELVDDFDEYVPSRAERAINVVTTLLTMLLLGGSLVFWWVVLKYLLVSPYSLQDPVQMEALLISCTVVPVIVAAGQTALRRPLDAERWLVCMCLSGVLTTVFIYFLQTVARDVGMSPGELPTLLCCAVSGSALPSVIFYGLRLAVVRARDALSESRKADWLTVRADVLALTDFEILR